MCCLLMTEVNICNKDTQTTVSEIIPITNSFSYFKVSALARSDSSFRLRLPRVLFWAAETASSLHPDPRLLPQGLDLLKPFLKSILVPSATVHLYNVVLITTSKPSCSTIVGLIVSFMNMYSILHAFIISVTDCWVVLLLLLSLYCTDLFSCKAASVFALQ